ncbi:YvrJ family protein [Priestia flexa]
MGFPIAVAFYLLIRFEKKIDDLTKTINHIATIIEEKKKTRSKNVQAYIFKHSAKKTTMPTRLCY